MANDQDVPRELVLDGTALTLDDLAAVFHGEPVTLGLADHAREAVSKARAVVDAHVAAGDVVYGLTTGFGKLKSVAIDAADLVTLQENLILSHCCGVGEPMPEPEVRVAQVLRLNGLVRGHSGIRLELADRLVGFFTKGFVPHVPQQGSVGASGDLAPLAHMTAAYMGHGRAWQGGGVVSAADALRAAGEEPLVLTAKEGLALINGTEISKAVSVGVVLRSQELSKVADVVAAMTIDCRMGSVKPFDDRLAQLKGHAGHARTARNVRALLEGSRLLESHADCDRVQDPYSMRCVPQIHGAFKTALEHVVDVLGGEINGVTDNPILFPETGEVVSAGQFHGMPVSMLMDYLGLALCSIGNVSERRIEQMVNPDLSELPPFLTPNPGLNSGFMIAQVAAAALVSENKVYAHPASVDTVPTSANQEDHVPMAATAARKARTICDNVERVLAIELLCAAQACDLVEGPPTSPATTAVHDLVRKGVAPMEVDRYLADDIEHVRQLVASGAVSRAAEGVVGELLP